MGALGILADVLVLGATIKIMDEATEPLRESHKDENGGLGFFN